MPGESSYGQEWVSGEVTKREIRKQKGEFGQGGYVCMGEGGNFFSLSESLKCLSLVPQSLHGALVNNIPPSPCGRRRAKQDTAE